MHHFFARAASSSTERSSVLNSMLSLSSFHAKRHMMYAVGVSCICFSRWWNACCATYASRSPAAFQIEPDVGSCSPTRTFIAVDLPAPLAPITATRLTCDTVNDTSIMVGLSLVGYWKVTLFILKTTLLRLFTPSMAP